VSDQKTSVSSRWPAGSAGVPGKTASVSLIVAVFSLIVYSAWVFGGTCKSSQPPILAIGLLMFIALLVVPPYLASSQHTRSAIRMNTAWLFTEPIFYLGFAFTILLLVQWFNAGRSLSLDQAQNRWAYSAPGIPWLPSAFSSAEAMEMIIWFIPAWAVALTLRSPWLDYDSLYTLWKLLVINSGLLAVFGIVQFASGTTKIYWTVSIPNTCFFASFPYSNHAGAFFVLMLCLSGALLVREMLRHETLAFSGPVLLWLACSILCLSAASLSLSRAAILFAWGIAVSMIMYVMRVLWPRIRPAARVNLVAAVIAVVFLACFIAASFGKTLMATEISNLVPRISSVKDGVSRVTVMAAGVDVWKTSPWFGVGGWGFRYLVALYLPADVVEKTLGLANVHNDPLQFLIEFGLVGAGLMLAIVMTMARPLFEYGISRRPSLVFAVTGVVVVLAHSLLDLPFRCPAIMYVWLAALGMSARLCQPATVPSQRMASIQGVGVPERKNTGNDNGT
jgi:hypothetical protein